VAIRRTFLIISFVMMALVLVLELAAPHLVGGGTVTGVAAIAISVGDEGTGAEVASIDEPPGRGISYLAFVDVALVFLLGQYLLSQVLTGRVHGRVTGIGTLVGSFVMIFVALIALIIAIIEIVIMISLFFAFPFGTAAYMAIWGGFPRGQAAALLSALLVLQIVSLILLVLAQPKMLQQRGFVILAVLALVLKLVLSFLHAFVPRPLVAIADDLGAIINSLIGLVLAIVFLIVSIPSIVKALRVDRLA